MLVLGVDTATAAVTAVLAEVTDDDVRELATEVTVAAQAHGERLAPAIEAVLTATGRTPADLVAVVAGTGPGPFTGLRVGLVTATALGQTLAIPTYDVCTLDALGAVAGAGRVLVATDARRKEIYWATYLDGVRQTGPAVARPAEVADGLAVDRAVGAGAVQYAEILGVPVADEPRYPVGTALVALAADRIRAGAPGETLVPRYLRRPDVTPAAAPKPAATR
ncbi:tRNA (adenosine(37)-N6)-threonylcarbamoyltransferase complex dimerization subunit type 1 TsaB [Actinocatenispora sera]|uniref:tRNA (Adenosine(37)-N6)-threonylcarbamoyltransferase complex dimerization subunit type 1 TsaB n=1 Tax=Actinocatenispora sera TaxID=390989 RepID=A0A810L0U9_9ACTN|nr:tRNA (adenosine(37)-N6)-threonylcarbamoyltransferase complex dimerization subunit type 1 TsaB [Actinocatenispora sera]BCJ28061.1 tRNA (adenosine(37)-N6)-threonylcarbamoyltransferase complex dimerization subunit type 1 TsaB [Actinocatenispora sera]